MRNYFTHRCQDQPENTNYFYHFYNNGNSEIALNIIEQHVDGKTFEPEVLYHIAEIYKANNKTEAVTRLKKELTDATYELGPVMAMKIQQL